MLRTTCSHLSRHCGSLVAGQGRAGIKARRSATIENRTNNPDGVYRSAGPPCSKHIRADDDSNRFPHGKVGWRRSKAISRSTSRLLRRGFSYTPTKVSVSVDASSG